MSAQMKHLFWRFWWADQRFIQPGLWMWVFGNNRRILPWRKAKR